MIINNHDSCSLHESGGTGSAAKETVVAFKILYHATKINRIFGNYDKY